MIKHQLFIGAALIAGVAIGFFAAPTTTVVEGADESYVPANAIADEGESASIAALRARIAELEAQLKGDKAAGEELVSNAVSRIEGRRRNREEDPGARMERLKTEDPERYAQMTNRFAQWRQAHRERQQSKLDFLGAIDTTHMSASAKATHEKLQDLIIRRDEIENELQAIAPGDDESRREVFGRLMEVNREIAELNGEERKNLLNETAKILGLGDAEADALSETVQDVLEATDNGFGGGPGGPGGQRGGRGGRGR